MDQALARVSVFRFNFSDLTQSAPLPLGHPICLSHPISFRWHSRRHWIKLPAFPDRYNSSWLDVYPFYDVGVYV